MPGKKYFYIRAYDKLSNKSPLISKALIRWRKGDMDGDGDVDVRDLARFLRRFGTTSSKGDFNENGFVGWIVIFNMRDDAIPFDPNILLAR